jgi:hypothetical protein
MRAESTAIDTREHRVKYVHEVEGEVPLPEPRSRESEVFGILDALPVNSAVKVNRGPAAVRACISRYRQRRGRENRFIVRQLQPGWSRVWRIA